MKHKAKVQLALTFSAALLAVIFLVMSAKSPSDGTNITAKNQANQEAQDDIIQDSPILQQEHEIKGPVEVNESQTSTDKTPLSESNAEVNQTNPPVKQQDTPEIDEDFFKNAVFIGDSITEGISSYGLLDSANVIAHKGLTLSKAETEVNNIAKLHPKRIYILFGANDLLYGITPDQYTSKYTSLVQRLKAMVPEAEIYAQSIFPVAAKIEAQKPLLANSRIDEFNQALKSIAHELKINYVDISLIFKDEGGSLKQDYTSDGLHIKLKCYNMWLDYLKKI